MAGKLISIEEAKRMEGTEFTFVFEDGDSVKAYVKKFDPEVGLTCLTLETETEAGWVPCSDLTQVEEDGTFCVIGVDIERGHSLEGALARLTEIKETGKFEAENGMNFSRISCAFTN